MVVINFRLGIYYGQMDVMGELGDRAWATTVHSPKQHFVFTVYKSTSVDIFLSAYFNLSVS